VTFRIVDSIGQDGLVFGAVVPSFCSFAAGKFDNHTAVALGHALYLGAFAAAYQIFTAILRQSGWHLFRIFGITLWVVHSNLSDDISFGHVVLLVLKL
jgi:hypothetical protein